MWQSLGPWLAGSGGVSIVGGVCYLLNRWHRDAVQAHKDRAQDWRERSQAESARADAERARADARETQLGIILGRASETV